MEKRKRKIWVIVALATLSVAGGLAVVLNGKTALFKGTATGIVPTVRINSPANNSTVSGQTSISITAGDDKRVLSVRVYLDSDQNPFVTFTNPPLNAPQTSSWDTTQATNARHTIKAVALDGDSNLVTATIGVTVNNPPPAAPATANTGSFLVREETAFIDLPREILTFDAAVAATAPAPGISVPQQTSACTSASDYSADTCNALNVCYAVGDSCSRSLYIGAPADNTTITAGTKVTVALMNHNPNKPYLYDVTLYVDGKSVAIAPQENENQENEVDSYTFTWDTTGLAAGAHTLIASATNHTTPNGVTVDYIGVTPAIHVNVTAAGGGGTPATTWSDPYCSSRSSESSCLSPNVGGNSVCYWTPAYYSEATVDNPGTPASCNSERGTITMIWPTANSTVEPSPQIIRAKAINISTPHFKVNGAEIPAVKDTAIYTWKADWNATNLPDGAYIISVSGIDQHQRAIESNPSTFTVTIKKPAGTAGSGSTGGSTGGTAGTTGGTTGKLTVNQTNTPPVTSVTTFTADVYNQFFMGTSVDLALGQHAVAVATPGDSYTVTWGAPCTGGNVTITATPTVCRVTLTPKTTGGTTGTTGGGSTGDTAGGGTDGDTSLPNLVVQSLDTPQTSNQPTTAITATIQNIGQAPAAASKTQIVVQLQGATSYIDRKIDTLALAPQATTTVSTTIDSRAAGQYLYVICPNAETSPHTNCVTSQFVVAASQTTPPGGANTTLTPDPAFKYNAAQVKNITQGEKDKVAAFNIKNSSTLMVKISSIKLFYAPESANLLPYDKIKEVNLLDGDGVKIYDPVQLSKICQGATCEDYSAQWQGLNLTINPGETITLGATAAVKSTAPADKIFYFRITPKSVSLQDNSFVTLQGSPAPASFDMKQFKVVATQTPGDETGDQPQPDPTPSGNIEVSPDPNFDSGPSHKIAPGDKDFTVASFFIENKFTQAQAIQKININYDSTSTLTKDQLFNIKLIKYPSTTIGAAVTLSAANTASWTLTNLSLPAASTTSKPQQFKVVASLKDSAQAGKNFSFYITPASVVAQNATTNMATAINMPAFTVTAPEQNPADGEPAKLTVSLSSGTPPDGQIHKPTDGAFTATELNMVSTGEVQFRAVTINMKAGIANALPPGKIARVQLFDENGNSISNPLTFDSNGRVRLPTSWKFAGAGTHKLLIKVTLAGDATPNTQFALGIMQNSDIELSKGTVNVANFPVFGNNMQNNPPSGGDGNRPPPAKITCEDRGKYTYTGGMCIDCPITVYVRNGGQCEVAKAAEKPASKPAAKTDGASIAEVLQASSMQLRIDQLKQQLAQAKAKAAAQNGGQNQAAGAGASGQGSATGAGQFAASSNNQRGAASEPTLTGSQRLVRAPDRSGTGPEVLVYFGILAIAQGAMIIRKKLKK